MRERREKKIQTLGGRSPDHVPLWGAEGQVVCAILCGLCFVLYQKNHPPSIPPSLSHQVPRKTSRFHHHGVLRAHAAAPLRHDQDWHRFGPRCVYRHYNHHCRAQCRAHHPPPSHTRPVRCHSPPSHQQGRLRPSPYRQRQDPRLLHPRHRDDPPQNRRLQAPPSRRHPRRPHPRARVTGSQGR